MALVAASVALWAAIAGLFPDHAGIFFHRLLLGSRHYPTRTTIEGLRSTARPSKGFGPARGRSRSPTADHWRSA